MHISKALLSVAALACLSGCHPGPSFVVSRDVPSTPTFVVVPMTLTIDDIEFAGLVESYLISAGLRTVDVPATRKAVATDNERSFQLKQDEVIGSVASDYILWTEEDARRVKIVRRTDGEVLASFVLNQLRPTENEGSVHEALRALGIRILEK